MAYREDRLKIPILIIEYDESTYYLKVDNIDKITLDDTNEIRIHLIDGEEYYFFGDNMDKEYVKLQTVLKDIKCGKYDYSCIKLNTFEDNEE